jgi:type IV pilus assembly protein PilA
MLARLRKTQEENEGGFTLIELLVVMIIIGILAAIAIPVFLNQRKKAQDSAAKADVSTVGKELATYFVDNTVVPTLSISGANRYTLDAATATPPVVAQDLGKASANVAFTTGTGANIITDSTHWCVSVTNSQGSVKTYKYSASGGLSAGGCSAADVS